MYIYKVYLLGKLLPVYVKCSDYIILKETLDFYDQDECNVVASFRLSNVLGFKRVRGETEKCQ